MRKTTKGALAASAAGVLLIGGAGTLAYWNDTATINGGSLTAGQLDLAATTCDSDWQLDSGAAGNQGDLGTDEIVPGDTLRKDCTYTLTVDGDHFEGELSIAGPSAFDQPAAGTPSRSLWEDVNLETQFLLSGTGITGTQTIGQGGAPVDFADGTYTIVAEVIASFPYDGNPATNLVDDVDNGSQNGSIDLDDFTLTVTQVDNH